MHHQHQQQQQQQQQRIRIRGHQHLLLLLLGPLLLATVVHGSGPPVEDYRAQQAIPQQTTSAATDPVGKWDHNYSCIFQPGTSFTYLHIAYVTYFNISRPATYCSVGQCLDTCTSDCSCTAIVYDVPSGACYQYHDYVPVQAIPFIPVHSQDTITAYIKVQNGYYYSSAPNSKLVSRLATALLVLAAALVAIA